MFLKELNKFLNSPNKKNPLHTQVIEEKITHLSSLNENENCLEGKYIILGVPDDRGVIACGNNAGAKEGPDAFRNAFYQLFDTQLREYNPITHHPYPPSQKKSDSGLFLAERFVDAGNIIVAPSIEETHYNISQVVEYLLNAGANTIFVIGGGHDISYGSYKGHVAAKKNEIIPIINYDARFGLRPLKEDTFTSENTFYKIIQDFPKNVVAGKALLEIGMQRELNPCFLYEYAIQNKIPVVEYLPLLNMWRDLQQAHNQLPIEHVRDHIDDCAEKGFNRYMGSIHLSLCLNIFNQSFAPGTSASAPLGIQLHEISDSLVSFSKLRACRVVDIAELCPAVDIQNLTARFVASLVYRFALIREEYSAR